MAEATIEFLIEKLKQQLICHAHLIPDYDEVEKRFRHLKTLIRGIPKQSRDDEEQLSALIHQIRKAVYVAEDTIDAYVTRNELFQEPPNIATIVEEIEAALQNIQEMRTNFADDTELHQDGGTTEVKECPVRKMKWVVGLEKETQKLVDYLLKESAELKTFSIIGMPGQGKTILAEKIFYDPNIAYEFPTRIWVYLSRSFTAEEIFLDILKEFTILSDDIKSKNAQELADVVVGFLEDKKFLMVMDDLWSTEDWDRLKVALPMNNKMGRVLITSRVEEVGWHVNRHEGHHHMRFLCLEDSYILLYMEAFGHTWLPPELEHKVRLLAEVCYGTPLSIVLIAGILVKKFSTDVLTMKTTLESVYVELVHILGEEDHPLTRMKLIIMLSYKRLPYNLRECFLYFGMFPEDFEIPVWKLIRLWIAEGFIQEKVDVSLEETAENYLEELIDRKLVRDVKINLHGKAKACRVHDSILDFCIDEAARDGFFKQIKMGANGDFEPLVSEELKFRRLCIHSYALNFVSKKPSGPGVRSFVCSSREEMSMPMKDLSAIPKGFKLLRVLDVQPINFNLKLPRDMFQLLHLRFIFLSVEFAVLPYAFSQFLNLETLVFNTRTRTLEVRADILSLTRLRHFKTKASAALPETSAKSPTAGESIQTLGTISPESCRKDVFDRACNLKKLGIRGNLALLLDGQNESIDSLGKMEHLEKLKLLYDVYPIPPTGLEVLTLPPPHKFPPKLKILTLSRTCLKWCQMAIIALLENLEVLKLENKAFVGDTWELSDGGFRCLELLRIERTNLKIWSASDNQFPKLKHLQLRYCVDLQQIPVELASMPSFRDLELVHCKRGTAAAEEIAKKAINLNQFTLSISPSHIHE